jgi:uncharacterized Zn-binding protein involved in type VI secretion
MPAAHRHHDTCTGHSCFPPRQNIEGSPTVFINGQGAHRVGDHWAQHACPGGPPHDGRLAQGSPTVFIDGQAAGRIGDAISCGSRCATGSPDVVFDGQ